MHPFSLIFLGLCAFLLGFWLVRKLEKRKIKSSDPHVAYEIARSAPTRPAPSANVNRNSTPPQPSLPVAPPRETAPVQTTDIRDLILDDRQSEAVEMLHEQKGWDLEHAQDYVAQQAQQQSSRDIDPEVVAAAQKLLAENRKIVAIKLIYEHTGWSLKAAKDYVEQSLLQE